MVHRKISVLFLLWLILFPFMGIAQDEIKFGKVSKDELAMSQYLPNTSAVAVYLFKQGETEFTYDADDGFGLLTEYSYRIKILKPEGKKYADITIPFYYDPKGVKENVSNIKAIAYNLENGKIKKSELSKKYIFEEKSSGSWRVMKFSIPNVQEGTVIEYKYIVRSNDAYHIDPWVMQEDIPVSYARYQVEIPEYFKYRCESKGYERIHTLRDDTRRSFDLNNSATSASKMVLVNCGLFTFISMQMPAIKDEPFLWCVDDYNTIIEFELDGIQFPGVAYRNYTTDWTEVKKSLKKIDAFGGNLDMKNPFLEEMKAMKLSELSSEEKIRAVFNLLKSKMKWNRRYNLYADDIKEAIRQGSGNNAELNFILLSMLRDAGVIAKPILLRTRTQGKLPLRPTLNKLNTFVVAAYGSDGTPYYLDGSIEYGDINLLPPVLMVSQAIVFDEAEKVKMVDLSKIGQTMLVQIVSVNLKSDGTFTGNRQTSRTGQAAVSYKSQMTTENDSTDVMRRTEEKYNVVVDACETEGTKGLGNRCSESLDFSGEALVNEDHIYINPMIFPDETENPFTNATRKFPVEFPYAQSVIINVNMTIPDGYVVDEMPKNSKMTMNNKEVIMSYVVRQENNQIVLQYSLLLNTPYIDSKQYNDLRTFWENLVGKNTQQLVLKKAPLVQP